MFHGQAIEKQTASEKLRGISNKNQRKAMEN